MPDLDHQAKLVAFGYSTVMPGCAISLKKGRLRHTTVKRIELSIWLLYSIITAVPAVAVVSLTELPRIGTWCGAFLMLNVALSDRLRTGEGRTSCRRDFVSRTSGVGPRSVHSERSTRLETF